MGINSTEVAYGFGQLGSGFVDDNGAFTPPTGMVIVAIQVLADTKIATLTPEVVADAAYVGTVAQVALNGTNSEPISATTVFPKGITLFGRWSALTTTGGTANTDGVICYFGR